MIEKVCNLWAEPARYRCIPTNGTVSKGIAAMNSGISLEAAQKFIGLSSDLGRLITSRGNHVQIIRPEIVAFPVKQYEWQDIIPQLVKRSLAELLLLINGNRTLLPRFVNRDHPLWQETETELSSLPDNIIII